MTSEMHIIKQARIALTELIEDWPQEPNVPKDFAMLGIEKLKQWEDELKEKKCKKIVKKKRSLIGKNKWTSEAKTSLRE
jgi:hypothetical protein